MRAVQALVGQHSGVSPELRLVNILRRPQQRDSTSGGNLRVAHAQDYALKKSPREWNKPRKPYAKRYPLGRHFLSQKVNAGGQHPGETPGLRP